LGHASWLPSPLWGGIEGGGCQGHGCCGSPPSQPPPQGGRCFDRGAGARSGPHPRSAGPLQGAKKRREPSPRRGARWGGEGRGEIEFVAYPPPLFPPHKGEGDLVAWSCLMASLPLVGRDRGRGWRRPRVLWLTPLPASPRKGGGADRGCGPLRANATGSKHLPPCGGGWEGGARISGLWLQQLDTVAKRVADIAPLVAGKGFVGGYLHSGCAQMLDQRG